MKLPIEATNIKTLCAMVVSAVVLAACGGGGKNIITPVPNLASKNRAIIFVWDGMRPDSINATDTPTLYAMTKSGSYFTDHHSTYPTFTMMNGASLATGSFPGTSGFYGNSLWQPGPNGVNANLSNVDFNQPVFTEDYKILDDLNAYYNNQLFLVGTLFSAAQKAGLVTAAVGKSGPAYLQDGHRGGYILDENTVVPLSLATELTNNHFAVPANTGKTYASGQFVLGAGGIIASRPARVNAKFANGLSAGDPSDRSGAAATANNKAMMDAYLNYILPTKRPDLSLIWFRDPDSTQHNYGPGSGNQKLALQAQDARLGELQAKLKALGIDKTTNVIVVSDHGHSNVSGDTNLFPLRAINAGVVGAVNANGYSTSGDVRTADLLSTVAGLPNVFDGMGCASSALSGQKADGSFVYPVLTDTTGVCGTVTTPPFTYQTRSYKVPSTIPANAIVVAANGGSDYIYVKDKNPATVQKIVSFLQSHKQYGAVFVAKKYANIPGTITMDNIKIENTAGRNPDIIVSFTWDDQQKINGMPGIEYESFGPNRGMHGSFGPTDVHNTLVAMGPDFQAGFTDTLPTGNVDVAPTVAQLLGISLPAADGRPLYEALSNSTIHSDAYSVVANVIRSSSATVSNFFQPTSITETDIDIALTSKRYWINVQTKTLSFRGTNFTYFDYAKAIRQ